MGKRGSRVVHSDDAGGGNFLPQGLGAVAQQGGERFGAFGQRDGSAGKKFGLLAAHGGDMKRSGVLLTVLAFALASGSRAALAEELAKKADDDKKIEDRGKELAPVPLNLKGKDKKLVYRGSYIVNAASDCARIAMRAAPSGRSRPISTSRHSIPAPRTACALPRARSASTPVSS